MAIKRSYGSQSHSSDDNKRSKSRHVKLYNSFKYGLEYETLVKTEELHQMHDIYRLEYEDEPSNSGDTMPCDMNKKILNYDNEILFRKLLKESIESKIADKKYKDIHMKYQWDYNNLENANCPLDDVSDIEAWIVTYDGSVKSNPSRSPTGLQPREKIPLYHKLDDLINNTNLLPATSDDDIIQNIEIVSPPLTRSQLDKGYLNKVFEVFSGMENLKYFNNEKTSNHIHLSCGTEFDNPRVLYNLYVIWMIIEPVILLMLPYWRRNNDRYCSSIYSTFLTRYKSRKHLKDVYNNLINIDLESHSLYDSVFDDTTYLRSIATQFDYPKNISEKQEMQLVRESQKTIDDTLNKEVKKQSKKEKHSLKKTINKEILYPKQDSDTDHAKISRMIIASTFQNWIGKAHPVTQGYKQNIARYSAFNSLNMLNINSHSHTVEIRIKHGSDEPNEIKSFIDLITEFFIVGIDIKDRDEYISLTESEINSILELGGIINKDYDLSKSDMTVVSKLVNEVMDIISKYIFVNNTQTQIDTKKYILEQIEKMKKLSRESIKKLRNSPTKMEMNGGSEMYGAGGPRKKWVFCYGSNGLKQLRNRVKHKGPWVYRPAVLPKHARIFSASSNGWKGAIASIWPDEKSVVYGMVVKMNAAEIALLDKYEGVHIENWYIQETVHPLDALTGEKYTAMVYVNQDIEFIEPPSIKYLQAIEENLKLAGLTDKQIGKDIQINIIDNNTIAMKKVGKWTYGATKIDFKSKKMAKMFNGGCGCENNNMNNII